MTNDLEVLYRKYSPMVFRRCRKILRNETDAKDASQDVFLRLIELVQEGYPISSYPCLLYTIATRKCFNRLRGSMVTKKKKEQGEGTIKDNLSREVSFSPLYEIEERIDENELVNNKLYAKEFLLSLLEDEEDKSEVSQVLLICYMYYFDEMGPKEIGETMGMSVSEVEKLYETRHIYFMYYFDKMTLEEIAEAKGMSHSGIHKRLEKIKKRINQLRKEWSNKME